MNLLFNAYEGARTLLNDMLQEQIRQAEQLCNTANGCLQCCWNDFMYGPVPTEEVRALELEARVDAVARVQLQEMQIGPNRDPASPPY